MRASIIIPTRNRAAETASLLDAVERERPEGCEVIVVDDASTDDTARRLSGRPGVVLLSLPRRAGPSRARNLGASRARGEVLVFLDSDVRLPEGARLLARLLEVYERHPDVDCVLSPSHPRPVVPSAVAYNYSVYHAYYMERLLSGAPWRKGRLMFFTTRLGAIRRARFLASGGFFESLTDAMNEDGELGARGYHAGFVSYVDASLVHGHRYRTRFGEFLMNYFRTAMVQAMIDRVQDTSPDPSLSTAEKARRVAALALLASPAALGVLPPAAYAVLAGAGLAVFIASFGRMNRLLLRHVPARYWPGWYAAYIGVTPAILLGYLWGRLRHARGSSLLKGPPSDLPALRGHA